MSVVDKIQPLRAYLVAKPDDRFTRYALALELNKAGDVEGALTELRELLRRHPRSGAGHYQHGLVLHEADRDDEARAAWTAGLEALRGIDEAEARRSRSEIANALASLD